MLKKSLAAVLAAVMTLALAIPAFATGSADEGADPDPSSTTLSSESTDGTYQVDYTSVTRVPYLNITITGKGAVILNPYQIKYTGSNAGNTEFDNATNFNLGTAGKNGQVISAPLTITSKTLAPVQVGVSIKTTVTDPNSSDAKKKIILGATKPTDQEMGTVDGKPNATTNKKICMWLAAADTEANAAPDKLNPFDATAWKTAEYKPFLILDPAKTVENKKLFKIPVTDGTDSGKKTCVLMFHGAMIPEPVDNPWTKGDKVTPEVTITLNVMKITSGNGS